MASSSVIPFSDLVGSAFTIIVVVLAVAACSGPPDQENGASSSTDEPSVTAGTSKSEKAPIPSVPTDSLSEAQWQKLDHALKLLLREGPDNPFFTYQTGNREGDTTYAVLIRTSDPGALAREDLPLGEPSSKVLTARLTTEEIRRTAHLEPVVSISNPDEAELH